MVEGHLCSDYVPMCVMNIPPKFALSGVIGFLKGKSAISIARNFTTKKRDYTGESFF
jgi:putative transposase